MDATLSSAPPVIYCWYRVDVLFSCHLKPTITISPLSLSLSLFMRSRFPMMMISVMLGNTRISSDQMVSGLNGLVLNKTLTRSPGLLWNPHLHWQAIIHHNTRKPLPHHHGRPLLYALCLLQHPLFKTPLRHTRGCLVADIKGDRIIQMFTEHSHQSWQHGKSPS